MSRNSPNLPRLLYIGDVPVESSYAGSALLYRLLQTYPAGQVCLVEAGFDLSRPNRRLPGAAYAAALLPGQRWLHSRLHRWVSSAFTILAPHRLRSVEKSVGGFQPSAVLTVAHGYSWITAGAYARRHSLPLHFFVHDDWPRAAHLPGPFAIWLDREFSRVYRQAASRLCISPFMQEEYAARYGVPGTVLYPSRAPDGPVFDAPPERLRQRGAGLTCAYAGTINSEGYARPLRLLAEDMAQVGGRLLLFGPAHAADARQMGLAGANVELRGLLKSAELIHRLREEADVLFVPMSSAPGERDNMMHGFPSKLTDYTAAGLPILIYGPEYSSAVRWARENPNVAEVVVGQEADQLAESLRRLSDPARRLELGARALIAGRKYFSHESALRTFYSALRGETDHATRTSV